MVFPIETAAFAITLIGLTYAAFTDLKNRTINDLIPILFLAFGILLHAYGSFLQNDYSIIGTEIAVAFGTFIGGYVLWKIGFWAGGDVKLFTGIAALNPYNFAAIADFFSFPPVFAQLTLPVFPLSLLIASALCMLPVGILLAAIRLRQKPLVKEKIVLQLRKKISGIVLFGLWITGIHAWLLSFGQPDYFFILGALLYLGVLKLPEKIRWSAIGIVFLYAAFLSEIGLGFLAELAATLLALAGAALVLTMIINAQHVFRSEKKIADLSEGDIVGTTLIEQNGQIKKRESAWQILKNLKTLQLAGGREICSAQSANGLEAAQIAELRKLQKQGKIGETIMVKESTAFVPAIWVAYIVLQSLGDPWTVIA